MQHYEDTVLKTNGDVVVGGTVTVYAANTVVKSTIYSDDGITVKANPVTTGSLGQFDFYAANGIYDLLIEYDATSRTLQDVILFDPISDNTTDAETDLDTLVVTTAFKVPTAAPAAPAAGHIWSASGVLKYGVSSKSIVDLESTQTISGAKTYSAPLVSTVVTGTAPFTVASTTLVTNLKADLGGSATSFFDSGTLEIARLPFGTANQILGTDSGATSQEHKTLAVGTSGTDFAIAHTANTITFNLPSASAANRGVITTGVQTIAGAKSFTGNMDLGSGNTFTIGDVVLSRSAADTLQLATGDAFVPQTTGQDLGATGTRWDIIAQSGDFSTTLAVTGATTLSSTLSYRNLTEVVAAANAITAAESGSVFFLDSATEFESELPALAAGLHYTFIVKTAPSGADYTIATNLSTNTIKGQVYTVDVNSATDPDFDITGGDTISFVSAKAVAGDRVEVYCDGTNWFAYCFCSLFDAITITTVS